MRGAVPYPIEFTQLCVPKQLDLHFIWLSAEPLAAPNLIFNHQLGKPPMSFFIYYVQCLLPVYHAYMRSLYSWHHCHSFTFHRYSQQLANTRQVMQFQRYKPSGYQNLSSIKVPCIISLPHHMHM